MSMWRNRGRDPALTDRAAEPNLYDPLTKLPGRHLFRDRLERALTRSVRRRYSCAVLSVDLDRFKLVNDSYGHEVGDQLLMEAAVRLDGCLRPEDSVARTGSDEFMILLEAVRDTSEAVAVAERIAAAFEPPVELDGRELYLSGSVGIAVGRGGRDRPEDVLQNADVAVHRAKDNGRGSYEIFRQEMVVDPASQLGLEADLRRALAADELSVLYQPEVELATGRIVAVEAMLHWEHRVRGAIEPAALVPLAEESGLVLPLARKLLGEACRAVARWPREVLLSLNFAARQLQQPRVRLVDELEAALAAQGVPPERVRVQLTEGPLHDEEAALAAVRDLERIGVRLAVDDFGTGYSSLTYLRRFPIDTVKLYRGFVAELAGGQEGEALVHALIEVGHALHATVLGAGVDTLEQAVRLRELGCELGQGSFFAPPAPAGELAAVLREGRPLGLAQT